MKNPPRVIFITSSLGREGKNFEHIMRVHFLSRITELIVICPKGADFSEHADIGTVVVNSCFPGKMGVIIEAIRWLSMKKNRRPAVVVITEPSVIGLVGFVAKVAFALPWVVDVWDIPLRYLGTKPFKLLKNQLTKALFRHLYRSADLFIVGIRPDMGFRYFRVPQEKILQWQTTICVPENPPDYQPKNENLPFRLLCMRSNHNRNMGLDVLGDAFSILEKKIPNIRLWIVGTIDEDVEKSITTLRASTRVTFTGFMKHPELMKLINEVDCCVIPWRDVEDLAQTYPAKVMEYLTQGKILVAARIKGISEMIDDGYNGLLFTPGNHIELAEKIETLIHNEKLRKYISTNAKVYNEKFDGKLKNQCIVDRLIKICENICSSGDVSGEGTSQNGLNVVFVCPARPKPGDANMNYYQRAYFLSRKTNLTILAPYGADYSSAVPTGTAVLNSPRPGNTSYIVHAVLFFLRKRKNGRVDIVISGPSFLGVCGLFARLLTRCRWVVDVWDIPIRVERGRGIMHFLHLRLIRSVMKYAYRSADGFIVSIIPDFELHYFGIPDEKMLLCFNAISQENNSLQLAVDNYPHNDFSILCMRSSYTLQMGLDTLADAFTLLKDVIPGLVLTIIGQIPPHVRVQVTKLQGLTRVRFIDYVEHDKLFEIIRGTTVCVVPFKDVPDLAQTYPIKVLEYFSLGRPVVASNIAGIRRIIEHGVSGLLFRAGDARDLAEKILLLYRDKQLRTTLALNAARYDERFDCRVKNDMIINSLHRLVTKQGGMKNPHETAHLHNRILPE